MNNVTNIDGTPHTQSDRVADAILRDPVATAVTVGDQEQLFKAMCQIRKQQENDNE